jgi:hypothetical protein
MQNTEPLRGILLFLVLLVFNSVKKGASQKGIVAKKGTENICYRV